MKRNQLNQNGYRIGVAGGRPGFTLVEMLTVIVIIGILAALISAATIYARARAREAAIYAQIKQMEAALMEYKNQFGEFPPDFCGPSAQQELRRHLRKRWPRYAAGADPVAQFVTDLNAIGMDPTHFDAATALVFWLGGLPAEPLVAGGTYQPAGFHADEEHPFQLGQPRTGPLFEFDPKRID
ncbi:MAG TPA: prepilin-type N-terminal cleavage/methylation domain-containing protein, partial [Thermogutta sp.]|nr:prepilin-type N-terminal cleavage/methylation domain-containing protein [Thermogutta sp.]